MILLYGSALLGLAFYEAIRGYRCVKAGRPFIPKVGRSAVPAAVLYVVVLLVFGLVSSLSVYALAVTTPQIAFVCGFSVPTGSRLLTPAMQSVPDDNVEDSASEEYGVAKPPWRQIPHWLAYYNV